VRFRSDLRGWALKAVRAIRGVVRVSGTATCFGVREDSRVVADPVGIRVVG